MKQQVIAICTVGLLSLTIALPVSAVTLSNVRETPYAAVSPAIELPKQNPPDAKGTVSFQNLESRVRAENLAALSLKASMDSQTAFDREKARKDLINGINALTDASWAMNSIPGGGMSLNSSIESMRTQLDNLKEEEYNKTLENVTRQLDDAIDQVVIGAQSLYVSIITYEQNLADMERGLVTMERNLRELELRQSLGQVAVLTVQQLESSYQSTKVQAESLQLGLDKLYLSLGTMLGEADNESLTLTPLPTFTEKQMALMHLSYDKALEKAKEKSYTIYSANRTFLDAKEVWADAKLDYGSPSYKYKMAEQTYQAAVYTYDSTVKNFELSFRALYDALADTEAALESAKATLAYQETVYAVSELKHAQGQISDLQLQTDKDGIATAESAIKQAEIKLFTARYQYCNAVELGWMS